MNTLFICIDPGVNGAVAYGELGDYKSIQVVDTPNFMLKKSGRKTARPVSNPKGMYDLLKKLSDGKDDVVVVMESVHARECDSKVSAFTFGENYGIWKGIIAATGLQNVSVTPQQWKRKVFGVSSPSGADDAKERSRQKCIELLPHLSESLKYKKDHNRAEAALLCLYALRWLDLGKEHDSIASFEDGQ